MEISTVFQTFLESVQGIFKREASSIADASEFDLTSKKINESNNEDQEQEIRESLFNKCR